MHTLLLSLRMLARDARAGELRVLLAALVIAVASVTSVGFFADRVGRALAQESHQLIGADLVVSADRPMPDQYASEAANRGLQTAGAATFPSMASLNGKTHLAGFKAVTGSYPLRGALRVAPNRNQPDAATREIPAPGTVWLDEQLAASLQAKPGDLIGVGDITLRFAQVLTLEPDRGASFLSIAPRLLMNQADLPRTNLIQLGSRVNYRLLVAGADNTMKAYTAWVKERLGRGQRLEEVSNARPEIRNTVARAQQFLGLVALLAVILAAVSVALGARRFMQRHLDGCAVLRAMGASQGKLFGLYSAEFLWLGLLGSAAGTFLGWAVHELLAALLGYLVAVELPAPTLMPALQGFATGTLLLLGFALPPLIQLAGVPPVRVIRREMGNPKSATLIAYACGAVALVLLILWQARDLKLGLIAAGGFAAALGISGVLTYGVLKLLARLRGEAGFSWRYGVAAMRRRSLATVTQVVALSLGLAALLMLTITRGDLIDKWQTTIPPDAPNRFIINILPEQRDTLTEVFRQNGVGAPVLYPMIRGRLIAINGKPTGPEFFSDDRARRLVDREFNLSYMNQLPSHNAVVQGQWFSPAELEQGALSVEEGIAKTLGLKIGDRLTYEIAGQTFEAPITNLRKLSWDSMRVNFFVIVNPKLLSPFPATYITSFHLPAGKEAMADEMVARMPNLTLIDVSAMIRQIKGVIDQVVEAVQFIFLFTLAAGMTVLYAALTASQDERTREAGILRSLGASSAQLKRAQWAEFILTGALAGLFASAIAFSVGYAVTVFVLDLPPGFNPWLWLAGIFSGAVCTMAGGWLALAGALKRPPMATLRDA
ncbi:MAG: putative ABC-type transport system involved in lysophospholipase biosynthesis, permease component [Betaproteobacteria bacterium]|nr:putative ABC-type transport system involved in lysophospholipase biosynthesis, permease component [Betaproteobacteria bacterium]